MARPTAKMSSPRLLPALALVLLATMEAPLAATVGKPLLSYIKPCSKNDPQLDDCARRHGNEALPQLVKGEASYQIPVLDPLLVNEVKVEQGSGPIKIDLVAKDMLIEGLKDTVIKDMRIDFANDKMTVDILVPKLKLRSKYTINGQVLVLPIRGDGDMTINLNEFTSRTNHEISYVEKQGVRFMRMKTPDIDFKVKSGDIHFTGLFNGDKTLGDHMNTFLNENWQEVFAELGPTIGEVIRSILDNILHGAVEATPFHLMYPEKL